MRRRLTEFNRAQIRRLAGEAVGDVRQRDAAVDCRGPRLQTEVQVFRVV